MNLVTLANIHKQYSERVLLDGVDLLVNEGDRIGLIGLNGSGKTTLLRIMAGLEPPDAGAVTVWGGVRIRYLPQEPQLQEELTVLEQLFQSDSPRLRLLQAYEAASVRLQRFPHDPQHQERFAALSAEMERLDGWKVEADAKAILTRLDLNDFAAPVDSLSGGQRKRLALACALMDQADLLILDEPTNHIDADTVVWLEERLLTTPGALLMVTHDRYFLDRVVNRIVELDRRQLLNYPGNYTHYLEFSTARHEQLAAAEEKRQNLLRRELDWLRRGPAARGTKQKARKQRVQELRSLRYDRQEDRVSMALASRRLGKQVLTVHHLAKSYPLPTAAESSGRVLHVFGDLNFDLAPGDRVGIVGPNGAGKTTFLDILAGKLAPDSGQVAWGRTVRLGYYDQRNIDLDEEMRVIDFIKAEAPLIETKEGERVEAAQMLEWFLFPRPQQWAKIAALSGGERRRLYLLRTLVHQPNVLLLDEPTNDLDIQTLTVLEEFLDHFQGCLIVASHDRYFLDRTVDYLVSFENGQVSARYPAPYSTYRRLREAQAREVGQPAQPPSRPRPARAAPARQPRPRTLSWKEQRELAGLEGRIHQLEAEQAALQAEVNASGHDFARLAGLAEQLQALERALDAAMERWLELSELAEAG